jgi:hypothetical protein
VAPVEAMVVDLGVLGGGHEIWAIEVLWWLCGFCSGWRRHCRWFLFSQGKGCYVLVVVGVEVVRC